MTENRFTGFRNSFISMTPLVKILFVILVIFISLFVSSVLSLVLAIPIFNVGMTDILNAISYPSAENLYLVKYFQVVQTVFVFVIPAVFAAWIFSYDTFTYLKAKKAPSPISLLLVLILMIVTIPFLNAVTEFNSRLDLPDSMGKLEEFIVNLEESGIRLTELFITMHNFRELAFNLFMIAILPAIGEEFLFRGVLQKLFTEWTKNMHVGIFIGAFVFSFFHLQFFGFLPRLVLGLYLGYLYIWSGTIWLPVAGHFINNALIVIYYYFSGEPSGETYLEKIGAEQGSYYIAAISLVLTLLIFFLINKSKPREAEPVG
jgi:uncharacterized protein